MIWISARLTAAMSCFTPILWRSSSNQQPGLELQSTVRLDPLNCCSGPVCHENSLKSVTSLNEWMPAFEGMTKKKLARYLNRAGLE